MNKYTMQLRLKEAAKLLNSVVSDVLDISNLAIQMKQEAVEAARKMGELVTQLYDMSQDKEDVYKQDGKKDDAKRKI